MDPMHMNAAGVIGGLIGAIIAILIGAAILLLINRIINGYWASYWRCIATIVVAGIIAGIINFIIGKIVGVDHYWVLLIIGVIVETLVGGAIMNAFVRREDGSPLGFKRAAMVFLALAILGALVSGGLHPWVESMRAHMAAPPAY